MARYRPLAVTRMREHNLEMRQDIERYQNPIYWSATLAIMLGLGAKQVLVAYQESDYIHLDYFILNFKVAPLISWIYWALIFVFMLCFSISMVLEWLKRRV
jgi:hypothetical protein